MKNKIYFAAVLLFAALFITDALAQGDDPVLMRINNKEIRRSEFEYSYQKNNSEGVIDKKSVKDYVPLFVNYKLKVEAALAMRLDTLQSFKKEFATYRDQQVLPSFTTTEDMEKEARQVYQETLDRIGEEGLIHVSHILMRLKQNATDVEKAQQKQRIDSIAAALKAGADFAELAEKLSQDPGTAKRGGDLPWLEKGQTVKEFETAAFRLKPGQVSEPVLSPFGFHIIKMLERKPLDSFEALKGDILKFLERRGARMRLAENKVSAMEKEDTTLTREVILEKRAKELSKDDVELRNLIQEYHDGLLLYEASNRLVWDKAAKDDKALEAFFKKNKKNYAFQEPRYKGIAYHVKVSDDVKAVRDCLKGVPFERWAEKLRSTFNGDSVVRIRVEKGIFRRGDNAWIDQMVFKKDTTVQSLKDYPLNAVYGKLLKKQPETFQDVRGLVVADLQDALEKQWVAELRELYPVEVDEKVLATVQERKEK